MEFRYVFVVMDDEGRKHLVASPKSASVGDLVRFNGGNLGNVRANMFACNDDFVFLKEFSAVHQAESIYSCTYAFEDVDQ